MPGRASVARDRAAASADPAGTGGPADAGGPTADLPGIWGRISARLRAEIGDAAFNSWLKPVTLEGRNEGEVTLSVPTRFMRDWVAGHYGDRLRDLWRGEVPGLRGIDICVRQSETRRAQRAGETPPPSSPSPSSSPSSSPSAPALPAPGERGGRATPSSGRGAAEDLERELSAPLDQRFTFENFVVGKSNELAHAAARKIAEAPSVPFNPLYLYGGVGLGKTHLMHAIGWHIRFRQPGRRVIYLSAEKFMYQFIRALRFKDTMAFKQQFRSVDVLMIDDVQFIAGKDSTQEEFFHTFNALVDQNRQIVISGDRSPSDLEHMEERLRSRLGWGLVADIHPTDYELRLGILQSKAERVAARQVPPKVLEFLAHRITSNVRELEGALNRVLAYSSLIGRPITLETAQEVLQDLLRANDRRVTIEEIQKRVAEHFNVRLADMHSARRARAVARPRQVAMYLAKQLTSRSLPEIGRKFGGRDHTTVMHAVRKIEELRETDAGFAEDIDLLRRMLES